MGASRKTPRRGTSVPRISALEEALALHLKAAKIQYAREVCAINGRKWRWDFWIADGRTGYGPILVECEGGIWAKGGHSTGAGITRDIEKQNAAVLAGYRPLRFTRAMIESGAALKTIEQALGRTK